MFTNDAKVNYVMWSCRLDFVGWDGRMDGQEFISLPEHIPLAGVILLFHQQERIHLELLVHEHSSYVEGMVIADKGCVRKDRHQSVHDMQESRVTQNKIER